MRFSFGVARVMVNAAVELAHALRWRPYSRLFSSLELEFLKIPTRNSRREIDSAITNTVSYM